MSAKKAPFLEGVVSAVWRTPLRVTLDFADGHELAISTIDSMTYDRGVDLVDKRLVSWSYYQRTDFYNIMYDGVCLEFQDGTELLVTADSSLALSVKTTYESGPLHRPAGKFAAQRQIFTTGCNDFVELCDWKFVDVKGNGKPEWETSLKPIERDFDGDDVD